MVQTHRFSLEDQRARAAFLRELDSEERSLYAGAAQGAFIAEPDDIARLEEEFDIELDEEDGRMKYFDSIRTLAEYVEYKLSAA